MAEGTHVPSYWPPAPGPIAFLAERPSDKDVDAEDRARAQGAVGPGPLIGRAGWRHNLICEAIGLERSTCYHGLVFSFQPPADFTVNLAEYRRLVADTAQTANVSTRYRSRLMSTCAVPLGGRYLPPHYWPELVRCWEELERLAALGTRVVVLYGETALWAVLGKTGIKPNRGHVLPTGFGDLLALATYHPAASFKQQTALALIVEDVRKAVRVATGAQEARTEANEPVRREPIILVPETATELRTALQQYVDPHPVRAWDIETTYPGPGVEYEVRSIQVCADNQHAIVVPLFWEYDKTRFYGRADEAGVVEILRAYLTDPAAVNVWHKGQFDRSALLGELGIPAAVTEDTLLMLHADNPSDPKDLSSGVARWLNVAAWKDAGRKDTSKAE